jgi:hypothetical protein
MIEMDGVPINAALAYDPRHGWLGAAEMAMLTLGEFRKQAEIRRSRRPLSPDNVNAGLSRSGALRCSAPGCGRQR